MFNREVQVKMVKSTKDEPITPTNPDEPSTASVISFTVDKSIQRIGTLVCTYVVLDTIRQVLIARASTTSHI